MQRRYLLGAAVVLVAVVALVMLRLGPQSGGPLDSRDRPQYGTFTQPENTPFTFWTGTFIAHNSGSQTAVVDGVDLKGLDGLQVLGELVMPIGERWFGMPMVDGRDDWWPPRGVQSQPLVGARIGPGKQAVLLLGMRRTQPAASFDAIEVRYHVGGVHYLWTERYEATWGPKD